MKIKYVEGIFVKRINRFVAEVIIAGELSLAHVANTGRCKELLIEGTKVLLLRSDKNDRNTKFSLCYVENKGFWVNLVSVSANKAVENSLVSGSIKEISNPRDIKPEYSINGMRTDFFCRSGEDDVYIEVKSVTLIKDGFLQFPDAPTARGSRHLDHLKSLRQKGNRAVIIFVAQHPLGRIFKPNIDNDPLFSSKLKEAFEEGVEVLAYRAVDEVGAFFLQEALPIIL